jgi:hypothetical protein
MLLKIYEVCLLGCYTMADDKQLPAVMPAVPGLLDPLDKDTTFFQSISNCSSANLA